MANKRRIKTNAGKRKRKHAGNGKARASRLNTANHKTSCRKTFLIIPVLISILLGSLAVLYFAYLKPHSLQNEQDIILKKLVSNDSELSVIVNDAVDRGKVQELSKMPYDELKSRIGVQNDFAIYFVNGEENLIPIGGRNCIGSPKANVAGEACG